jgi:2-keto-4-pentenoate hydratase/2-oxohepta-3-ene-1,7-dioic acid hydratase in catechol pathway
MKIVSFGPERAEQPGVLLDEQHIVPLVPVLLRAGLPALDTNSVLAFLPYLQPVIEAALKDPEQVVESSSTRLGPPVPKPEKIIVAGGNYQSHVDEASGKKNAPSPSEPLLIFKPSNTVIGPRDALIRPAQSRQLDYETEIAVVIGRGGHNIARDDAYDHIAGYMIGNDVTARDLAFKDIALSPLYSQITRAKGIPTGAPFGPWLVTKDEIADVQKLSMWLDVNGQRCQTGSTSTMIFTMAKCIAYLSTFLTLLPGDIVTTGTPPGVGLGMKPPKFLEVGDVMTLGIEKLGEQKQKVVAA